VGAGTFGTSLPSSVESPLRLKASTELSLRIFHTLTEALSGAGLKIVTHVETWIGWGDIHVVVVHTELARCDASPALRSTIHDVVGTVLAGRRHLVEIRWLPT
jgi:hypothetical protein